MGETCGIWGEVRNAYRVLVGKPERKRPVGRPGRGVLDTTNTYLKQAGNPRTGIIRPSMGTSGRLL
jgi:hypothetical protein